MGRESKIFSFQFFKEAYFEYIRKRSAANKAASIPPVPALISIITDWDVSLAKSWPGFNNPSNSFSKRFFWVWNCSISSLTKGKSSLSSSSLKIVSFSLILFLISWIFWALVMIFSKKIFLFENFSNFSQLKTNPGALSCCNKFSYSFFIGSMLAAIKQKPEEISYLFFFVNLFLNFSTLPNVSIILSLPV